jgi:hypothetical protein
MEHGEVMKARRWLPVVPAIVYAAILPFFVYRDVLGEHDMEEMALGILYKAATHVTDMTEFHYGYNFSFGYYALLDLFPRSVLSDSTSLIFLINSIGYVSAVLALLLLGLYLDRVFGSPVAVLGATLFAFSPMFLQLGTYGHPILPGLALFMFGAWVLTYFERFRWIALVTIAAFVAALSMRADIAFGLPFVAIAVPKDSTSFSDAIRNALPRAAVAAISFLLFLVMQRRIFGDQGGALNAFIGTYYSDPGRILSGTAVSILASGIATSLAAGYALFKLRQRSYRDVIALAALILPSAAFWLPNATPTRHLVFLTLGVALLAAFLLAHMRRFAIACLSLVVANQALAEITNPIVVSHRDWSYVRPPERAAPYMPMGAFFFDQRANQEYLARYRREGTELARVCDGAVVLMMDEAGYLMMAMVDRYQGVALSRIKTLGLSAYEAVADGCTMRAIQKAYGWPRDAVPDFLASEEYRGWHFYFQELTRGEPDKAFIPAERSIGPIYSAEAESPDRPRISTRSAPRPSR